MVYAADYNSASHRRQAILAMLAQSCDNNPTVLEDKQRLQKALAKGLRRRLK